MNIKTFIKECQNKDVLKLISIYLVSTWVLLQVLSTVWDPIGLPKESVTILILILVTAFPFYVYYIYKFRIHTDLEPDQSAEEAASIAAFKKHYFSGLSILAVLCAFAAVIIAKANFFQSDLELEPESSQLAAASPVVIAKDNIAVLKFGNNTAQDSYDVVGKMAADWIIQGINEKQIGQVISAETILQYSKDFGLQNEVDEQQVLSQYLKPSKIITGNYYLDHDQMVIQSSITDGKTSEVLMSFKPQYCDSDSPLECVDNVKQLVMSYLYLEDKDPKLNLQQSPPKFNSYQLFLEAKAIVNDPKTYLTLLNRSIEEDPNHFEPQVMRVAHYYGMGEYKKADSLRKTIQLTSYNNKRQSNLLAHYEALMAGKNDMVYETLVKEYQFTPQQLTDNSATMTVAQQYVNKPEVVGAIFKVISMKNVELKSCSDCLARYYVNALASIELGDYDTVIDSLKPLIKTLGGTTILTEPLIAAYIRSRKPTEAKTLLNDRYLLRDPQKMAGMYLYAGKEALLLGDIAFAKANFSKTIELLESIQSKDLVEALYYLSEFEKALSKLKVLMVENPKDQMLQSRQAILLAKTGDLKGAQKALDAVEASRNVYDYGATDYQLARYYASTGQEEQALELLKKSIAQGNIYTSRTFQNDPHFKSLMNTPKFKKIMTYWH
jgi:tetratricopeptide (TPR) repeat protein